MTESLWSPGSIVSAGTPLVRVVPIGQLQAVLWVEAEDVGNLAVGIVYTLLLFLYEDFRAAALMMFTVGAAAAVSLGGLWLTGTELNTTAMMGLTMIIGIVTEMLIFYYSEFVGLDPAAPLIDRLIEAGRNRARPIAMTTLAAILAMLPLALGLGEGSAMLKPMAIAIVSGLLAQFPLVIVVFPILRTLGCKRTTPAVS